VIADISLHDQVKIAALFYLRLRKIAGKEWVGANELSQAIDCNISSAYVLLLRWTGWKLIQRMNVFPYLYMIAPQGVKYLDRLNRWCDARDKVFNYVLQRNPIVFYWIIRDISGRVVQSNANKSPFSASSDFEVIKPNEKGELSIKGNSGNLLVKKANCLDALNAVKGLGQDYGKELVEALIQAGYIRYITTEVHHG
jgi:hypothetical protein